VSVGIVGSGISGLHLALRLQQLGIAATVYSGRTPEGMRSAPPRAFPVRFGATRAREASLGVEHWPGRIAGWDFVLSGATPLAFHAELSPPSSPVDFRIYLPRLLEDFAGRGGEVVVDADPDVGRLAGRHELVVVANGTRSMAPLFPRVGELSPHDRPQRLLCCGVYRGVAGKPDVMDIQFVPGVGEILRIPWLHPDGWADVVAFEAVPGGPLAHLADSDPASDPAPVLDALATWAPAVRDRIGPDFGLIGPGEVVRGGLVPVVRRGWAPLTDGVGALAIGDAWITNDPLTAQGANLGSHTAFALAGLIAGGGPYDEAFCRDASARLWEHAASVVAWSTAFLAPPPPHALDLFAAAARDRRVANAFVSAFNDPELMWRTLAGPAAVEEFVLSAQR
jgi:2-polyprenyl-6-methoxyphenol hydroxylase-like FAD-dependent oxidoreductase